MKTISRNNFEQVEIRTGTIINAQDFPEARKPAYKITVDFGETIGIKKSSPQITTLYTKEEFVGKQIVGVVNFPPKQIGLFVSEFLVTWFVQDDGSVVLAVPDKKIDNGIKLA